MNFIEMIGFVVSLLALFALAAKKAYDEKRRRFNPEEFEREEREQAEKLKAFLHSLDMDMEEGSRPKHPKERPALKPLVRQQSPSKPNQQPQSHTQRSNEKREALSSSFEKKKLEVSLERHALKSSLKDRLKVPSISQYTQSNAHLRQEEEAYTIKIGTGGNRAKDALMALKSKKEMIILNEILSPPKALRKQ